MVFHQTKGMNLEAGFLAGLAQGFDEITAIALIKEDCKSVENSKSIFQVNR
jgi:hypothetical protein